MRRVTFGSVWDGGLAIESMATLDEATGIVSDIEVADAGKDFVDGLDTLEREYIVINGREYDIERNDDDTYSVVRTYTVTFSRSGSARVRATSPQEAMRLADERVKYDDVLWDDDWNATDAQAEEVFPFW